jgi:hypothetical protein
VIEKFKGFSPELPEVGRYYHRSSMAIMEELRRMKADIQSFNKALNIVWASNPTGVTEAAKIAMAITIHCKFTKRMDYHYKNFDVTSWKFFGAWSTLKDTPKFQFHTPSYGNKNTTAEDVEASTTRMTMTRTIHLHLCRLF